MTPWVKDSFQNRLVDIDTILVLKTFYLATAAAILFAYWILPLKDRFLAYGARSAEHQAGHLVASKDLRSNEKFTRLLSAHHSRPLITLFDFLATLKVPHSWFITFYCISVASSMLWGYQLLTLGPLYQEVAHWTQRQAASMSHHRIILCWSLMALQGTRRLWECLMLTKPSQSTMWVFHWLAGILFYIATGMSLWIEGIPALESTNLEIQRYFSSTVTPHGCLSANFPAGLNPTIPNSCPPCIIKEVQSTVSPSFQQDRLSALHRRKYLVSGFDILSRATRSSSEWDYAMRGNLCRRKPRRYRRHQQNLGQRKVW